MDREQELNTEDTKGRGTEFTEKKGGRHWRHRRCSSLLERVPRKEGFLVALLLEMTGRAEMGDRLAISATPSYKIT
jgi:hypothetical protein